MTDQEQKQFLNELEDLLNKHNMNTMTNLPGWLLARTIFNQLEVLSVLKWEMRELVGGSDE